MHAIRWTGLRLLGALALVALTAATVTAQAPAFDPLTLNPNEMLVPGGDSITMSLSWSWPCSEAVPTALQGLATTQSFTTAVTAAATGFAINGDDAHSIDTSPCATDISGALTGTWEWQIQATEDAPGLTPVNVEAIVFDSTATSIASRNVEVTAAYVGDVQVTWETATHAGTSPLVANATLRNAGNAATTVIVSSLTTGISVSPAQVSLAAPDGNTTTIQFTFTANDDVDGDVAVDVTFLPVHASDTSAEGRLETTQIALTFDSPIVEKESPAPFAIPALIGAALLARRRSEA